MLVEDVRRRGAVDSVCPVERALAVVGSRNAMLVMREAAYGTTRFDGFAERTRTSPATTAAHLRALTDAGLLARRTYRDPGERSREEYVDPRHRVTPRTGETEVVGDEEPSERPTAD